MKLRQLSAGVDLVSVDEVAGSLDRFGEHYTSRVYTAAELSDAVGPPPVRAARLAARFAAKEAVLKACGAHDEAISWLDIEILTPWGQPKVRLYRQAAAAAKRAGIESWSVSMTHDAGLAAAFAVGWAGSE